MKIIGAGLAGLIAANIFQDAEVFERGPESQITHRALLRFRSDAVGKAVGIDFKPVTVHKGIWIAGGRFVKPTIQWANIYSRKVIGRLADRSIWNMEPATRWIAPEDFAERLAARCRGRILWDTPWDFGAHMELGAEQTISTMPLSEMRGLPALAGEFDAMRFASAPIVVRRWRVPRADVYQTVYFPEMNLDLYRASITGDLLIAEYMAEDPNELKTNEEDRVMFGAFGMTESMCEPLGVASQRFGKIAPTDERLRRALVLALTQRFNIFSLGRFATWRNILLDDVLDDITVLKRLINSDSYAVAKDLR